ncbi:hypothetical protein IWZ03DRAFT_116367 [Phyllosticta citriasiana]|uniref:F-box domain-containing protein n=1 Tax=Phyllosticta citriasiana TaxID=595635 RepID=A0ABR1KW01_9PEZI
MYLEKKSSAKTSMELLYNGLGTSDDGPVKTASIKNLITKAPDDRLTISRGFVENLTMPASRSAQVLAQFQAFVEKLPVKFTGPKASLHSSQPRKPCILLNLPAEIREIIWNHLAEGDLVTLEVDDTKLSRPFGIGHSMMRSFRDRTRPWLQWRADGYSRAKNRRKCNIELRRAYHGISISMLLACKQMQREIVDVFFRHTVVELNPWSRMVIDFDIRNPRVLLTEALTPAGTTGILTNVRFLSTMLRFNPVNSWQSNIEDMSWLFRLLRHCPQIRAINMLFTFTGYWDSGYYNCADGDQAETRVQTLASKIVELLPTPPSDIMCPRPVKAIQNLIGDWICWRANPKGCYCTWMVSFEFDPNDDDIRNASDYYTDFYVPGTPDWSNQIVFKPRSKRHNRGVLLNRLEQHLVAPMAIPKKRLKIDHNHVQPDEFDVLYDEVYPAPPRRRLLASKWKGTGVEAKVSSAREYFYEHVCGKIN